MQHFHFSSFEINKTKMNKSFLDTKIFYPNYTIGKHKNHTWFTKNNWISKFTAKVDVFGMQEMLLILHVIQQYSSDKKEENFWVKIGLLEGRRRSTNCPHGSFVKAWKTEESLNPKNPFFLSSPLRYSFWPGLQTLLRIVL